MAEHDPRLGTPEGILDAIREAGRRGVGFTLFGVAYGVVPNPDLQLLQLTPVDGDLVASAVAHRTAGELLLTVRHGGVPLDVAVTIANRLKALSDDDLAGVQALGMGIAEWADGARRARADRG